MQHRSSTLSSRTMSATYRDGESFARTVLTCLCWKEPSTIWQGHPVLGFASDTDLKDSKGNIPAEVGCRHFPPMWSYPPAVINSSTDNISFGMDVTHICENPSTDKDALHAQCPIDSDAEYGDKSLENYSSKFRFPRRFARTDTLSHQLLLWLWLRDSIEV